MTSFRKHSASDWISWRVLHGAVIGILTVLIVSFVFFIIDEVLTFQAKGELHPEFRPRDAVEIMQHGAPAEGVADVKDIQIWMTFDYVNSIFHLDAHILRDAFQIVDTRYPRVSILHFARETGRNPADILTRVQTVVREALMERDAR
jgi:hypothetical protein